MNCFSLSRRPSPKPTSGMAVRAWCAWVDDRVCDYITKVLQMVSSESKGFGEEGRTGPLSELIDTISPISPLRGKMSIS